MPPRRRNRNRPTQPPTRHAPLIGKPMPVPEIEFGEAMNSIRNTGICPVTIRGTNGHYAIARIQANNPHYLTTFDDTTTQEALEAGADVVVFTRSRQVLFSPDVQFEFDRPTLLCGCSTERPCTCIPIMNGWTPEEGFTDDHSAHLAATHCGNDDDSDHADDQILYDTMLANHDWVELQHDSPQPFLAGFWHSVHQCAACSAVLVSTVLPPMVRRGAGQTIDCAFLRPDDDRPSAT